MYSQELTSKQKPDASLVLAKRLHLAGGCWCIAFIPHLSTIPVIFCVGKILLDSLSFSFLNEWILNVWSAFIGWCRCYAVFRCKEFCVCHIYMQSQCKDVNRTKFSMNLCEFLKRHNGNSCEICKYKMLNSEEKFMLDMLTVLRFQQQFQWCQHSGIAWKDGG